MINPEIDTKFFELGIVKLPPIIRYEDLWYSKLAHNGLSYERSGLGLRDYSQGFSFYPLCEVFDCTTTNFNWPLAKGKGPMMSIPTVQKELSNGWKSILQQEHECYCRTSGTLSNVICCIFS